MRTKLHARGEDRLHITGLSRVCFLETCRPAKLSNLSTFGACGDTAEPPPQGAIITMILAHAGAREAQVRWVRGSSFGCRFLEPLSVRAVMLEYLRGASQELSASPGASVTS